MHGERIRGQLGAVKEEILWRRNAGEGEVPLAKPCRPVTKQLGLA